MAGYKILDLTELAGANVAATDMLTIVDISDTTLDATGTNKKISPLELQKALWRLYPEKVSFTFDGGGSAIVDDSVREWLVPWDCTITGWTGVADQTGSISIDLRVETYANYSASIPDSGDTIVASAPIALSSAIKGTDTTLTGWTTSLTAGSIVRFVVTSISTITRFHGYLHLRRTA